MSAVLSVKAETKKMAEQLNEDATWDDVLYEIHVRLAIEAGIKDADAGRKITTEELRTRLGLSA